MSFSPEIIVFANCLPCFPQVFFIAPQFECLFLRRRLLFIILFTALDVGQAIYKIYFSDNPGNTSYSGHAFGALSGLLIGVFVLENRKVEDWETVFR